jgi:hypothetical protein
MASSELVMLSINRRAHGTLGEGALPRVLQAHNRLFEKQVIQQSLNLLESLLASLDVILSVLSISAIILLISFINNVAKS